MIQVRRIGSLKKILDEKFISWNALDGENKVGFKRQPLALVGDFATLGISWHLGVVMSYL